MTPATPALEVLATGPQALVQDLGRPGLASLGVSPSGAADRRSFLLGARLLAQDPAAAALEVTLGGLRVRAHGTVTLALTGAPAPADIDGRGVGYDGPFCLRDGQTLQLAAPSVGLRTYLSVRGGLDVPAVLGSRATDTLSKLGPAPLQPGDRLPVGPPPADWPEVDVAPTGSLSSGTLAVRALVGPRADWLEDLDRLTATAWQVSARSDRVGVRLEGPGLRRRQSRAGQELPSEGIVRGAVQVPPGGEPVVFLADHPITGGYPVVAVVRDVDLDLVAQAVPGQTVQISLAPSHREGS